MNEISERATLETVAPRAPSLVGLRRLGRPSVAVASAALLLLTIALATSVGAVAIGPAEVVRVVLYHLHVPGVAAPTSSATDAIVWQVRLPRVLTAAVVGASLALSGASYQAVFRNPLADPFLLGVAAGAALGATIAIVSPLPLDFYHFGYVALFALVGALIAVVLTYQLARVGWTVPVTSHVLAGIAVSAAASAGVSLLMMLNEDRIAVVFAWLYGDFTSSSWSKLASVTPYLSAATLLLLLLGRQLNALQLNEDEAKALGVRVELVKAGVVFLASLATAACVAIAGLIGFVGLIVPHVCRLLFGADYRRILPLSLVIGAIFLILADLGARTLLAPQEIPVGILTGAFGAPFFLVLLRRQQREAST